MTDKRSSLEGIDPSLDAESAAAAAKAMRGSSSGGIDAPMSKDTYARKKAKLRAQMSAMLEKNSISPESRPSGDLQRARVDSLSGDDDGFLTPMVSMSPATSRSPSRMDDETSVGGFAAPDFGDMTFSMPDFGKGTESEGESKPSADGFSAPSFDFESSSPPSKKPPTPSPLKKATSSGSDFHTPRGEFAAPSFDVGGAGGEGGGLQQKKSENKRRESWFDDNVFGGGDGDDPFAVSFDVPTIDTKADGKQQSPPVAAPKESVKSDAKKGDPFAADFGSFSFDAPAFDASFDSSPVEKRAEKAVPERKEPQSSPTPSAKGSDSSGGFGAAFGKDDPFDANFDNFTFDGPLVTPPISMQSAAPLASPPASVHVKGAQADAFDAKFETAFDVPAFTEPSKTATRKKGGEPKQVVAEEEDPFDLGWDDNSFSAPSFGFAGSSDTKKEKTDDAYAAKKIQAGYRGMAARREVKVMHKSAGKIQAGYRGMTARREFQTARRSAVRIQSTYRGHSARKKMKIVRLEFSEPPEKESVVSDVAPPPDDNRSESQLSGFSTDFVGIETRSSGYHSVHGQPVHKNISSAKQGAFDIPTDFISVHTLPASMNKKGSAGSISSFMSEGLDIDAADEAVPGMRDVGSPSSYQTPQPDNTPDSTRSIVSNSPVVNKARMIRQGSIGENITSIEFQVEFLDQLLATISELEKEIEFYRSQGEGALPASIEGLETEVTKLAEEMKALGFKEKSVEDRRSSIASLGDGDWNDLRIRYLTSVVSNARTFVADTSSGRRGQEGIASSGQDSKTLHALERENSMMKQQMLAMEAKYTSLQKETRELSESLKCVAEKCEEVEEERDRLLVQTKAGGTSSAADSKLVKHLEGEVAKLKDQVASMGTEVSRANAEKQAAEEVAQKLRNTVSDMQQDLENSIKNVENNRGRGNAERLSEELDAARKELDQIRMELDSSKREVENQRREFNGAQSKLIQTEKDLTTTLAELDKAKKTLEELEASYEAKETSRGRELEQALSELATKTDALVKVKDSLNDKEIKLKQAESIADGAAARVEAMAQAKKSDEIDRKHELEARDMKIKDLEAEIIELQNEKGNLSQMSSETEKQKKEVSAELRYLRERVKELEQEKGRLESKLDSSQEDLSAHLAKYSQAVKEHETLQAGYTKSKKAYEAELQDLTGGLADMRGKYESAISELEQENAALHRQLGAFSRLSAKEAGELARVLEEWDRRPSGSTDRVEPIENIQLVLLTAIDFARELTNTLKAQSLPLSIGAVSSIKEEAKVRENAARGEIQWSQKELDSTKNEVQRLTERSTELELKLQGETERGDREAVRVQALENQVLYLQNAQRNEAREKGAREAELEAENARLTALLRTSQVEATEALDREKLLEDRLGALKSEKQALAEHLASSNGPHGSFSGIRAEEDLRALRRELELVKEEADKSRIYLNRLDLGRRTQDVVKGPPALSSNEQHIEAAVLRDINSVMMELRGALHYLHATTISDGSFEDTGTLQKKVQSLESAKRVLSDELADAQSELGMLREQRGSLEAARTNAEAAVEESAALLSELKYLEEEMTRLASSLGDSLPTSGGKITAHSVRRYHHVLVDARQTLLSKKDLCDSLRDEKLELTQELEKRRADDLTRRGGIKSLHHEMQRLAELVSSSSRFSAQSRSPSKARREGSASPIRRGRSVSPVQALEGEVAVVQDCIDKADAVLSTIRIIMMDHQNVYGLTEEIADMDGDAREFQNNLRKLDRTVRAVDGLELSGDTNSTIIRSIDQVRRARIAFKTGSDIVYRESEEKNHLISENERTGEASRRAVSGIQLLEEQNKVISNEIVALEQSNNSLRAENDRLREGQDSLVLSTNELQHIRGELDMVMKREGSEVLALVRQCGLTSPALEGTLVGDVRVTLSKAADALRHELLETENSTFEIDRLRAELRDFRRVELDRTISEESSRAHLSAVLQDEISNISATFASPRRDGRSPLRPAHMTVSELAWSEDRHKAKTAPQPSPLSRPSPHARKSHRAAAAVPQSFYPRQVRNNSPARSESPVPERRMVSPPPAQFDIDRAVQRAGGMSSSIVSQLEEDNKKIKRQLAGTISELKAIAGESVLSRLSVKHMPSP